MKNLLTKERVVEELAVNLNSIGIVLGFLSGYLIGTGNWFLGITITLVYLSMDNVNSRLWIKVWRNLRK